jgi:hypothetical protein
MKRYLPRIAVLSCAVVLPSAAACDTPDAVAWQNAALAVALPTSGPPVGTAPTAGNAPSGTGDFDVAGPPCPSAGNSPRLVLLSQALVAANDGGAEASCNDAALVQKIIFDIGQTGKLIVDRTCTLSAGLRLPSRFTLEGLGPDGEGQFNFTHDGIGLSICPESPNGRTAIRNLALYGPYADANVSSAMHSIGIAIASAHVIHIEDVHISDFHAGISGSRAFSVFITGSNVSNNRGTNIRIGYAANGWRVRDGMVNQSRGFGIDVLGPGDADPVRDGNDLWNTSNDLLIDGVRMESNNFGAIRTAAYSTRIDSCRFESNGLGNPALPHRGLLIDSTAVDARVLTNLFSSDCIQNKSATTQRALNMPAAHDGKDCAPLPLAP